MDAPQRHEEIRAIIQGRAHGQSPVHGVGAFLRDLRRSRRATLDQTAARAGIARSTLNRWEIGAHQPRLPELEAILNALIASPDECEKALSLIGAPRAARRLRYEAKARADALGGAWIYSPGGGVGELLRAMRHRQGLTQEQVTDRLKLPRQTLSRWETNETAPPAERIELLLVLFGAHSEERAALLSGKLSAPSFASDPSRISVEEIAGFLDWLRNPTLHYDPSEEALKELRYFIFESLITPLALRQNSARFLLVRGYAYRAHWLLNQERYREAAAYAERTLELIRQGQRDKDSQLRAVIVSARATARGGRRAHLSAGVALLQSLLPYTAEAPHFESWIYQETAEYISLEGRLEDALTVSAHAIAIAQRNGDGVELRLRRRDYVQLLLQAGRGSQAVDALPTDDGPFRDSPDHLFREYLLRGEALTLTGNAAEAQDWLARAYEIARRFGLDARRADALAQRL